MIRNKRRNRLTVEKLGADCLDVRALYRAGIFKDHWVTLPMVSLAVAPIVRMRVPAIFDPIGAVPSGRSSANSCFVDPGAIMAVPGPGCTVLFVNGALVDYSRD